VAEEGGNILGPGDFFGVVSCMSSHSHIETAMALTYIVLISVLKVCQRRKAGLSA